jgi:hypothetical protein
MMPLNCMTKNFLTALFMRSGCGSEVASSIRSFCSRLSCIGVLVLMAMWFTSGVSVHVMPLICMTEKFLTALIKSSGCESQVSSSIRSFCSRLSCVGVHVLMAMWFKAGVSVHVMPLICMTENFLSALITSSACGSQVASSIQLPHQRLYLDTP